MDYIRFAISNPVKVTVGVLLLLMFGAIAVAMIPVQLVPSVDLPIITVETSWTGRSPQEIEQEIVEEQEDKLKSLSNLKKMSAVCQQGTATIELEFFIGVDISRALQEVSDKLREVPEYPDDADEPVINAGSTDSENAIAWIILDSEDPTFDTQGFFDVADKRVKPYLERVPGISRVAIYGGRKREAHIRIDPERMAQRGITFYDLEQALREDNVNVSAGDLADGRLDVRVRTVGQYDRIEDIAQTVVRYTPGGPVRIADFGDVVVTLEKRRSFVRANGKPSLALSVTRESGSNVIQIMNGLRRRIKEVNENILPSYGTGLALRQVYDETGYIYDALALVANNLWIGGTLAVIVLWIFLGSVRPTVVIALAIPISVVGTFVVMAAFGRNLNVISLAGLAFAVGMVVDNAIVVLENIDRHLHMGKPAPRAAYDGTKEVWGAILASTLTTLAVFLPVLTIQEEAGQLFRDITLAISAAVTLSLIVSVTAIPSASARWLRPAKLVKSGDGPRRRRFGVTGMLNAVAAVYAALLHELMGPTWARRAVRVVIIVFFTLTSIGLASALLPDASYLPNGNKNLIFGMMLTPPAYNINHAESIGDRVEQTVRPYWEAESTAQATTIAPVFDYMSGQPFPLVPAIDNYFFVSWSGTIFMGCSSADKELVQPLEAVLSGAMSSIPGSFGFAQQASIFGRGIGGGNSIDVEIMTSDLARLRSTADLLFGRLMTKFGPMALRPDPANFNLAGPELRVQIDEVRAKDLGVAVAGLGLGVQALVDGAVVGDYRIDGESIDLVLVRHPQYPLSPDTLSQVPVAVRPVDGDPVTVPLSSIAKMTHTNGPQQINRIEQIRSIKLTVTPPDEMALETAVNEVQTILDSARRDGQIPQAVEINLAGTADKLAQVQAALLGKWSGWKDPASYMSIGSSRLFLALVVTFLLMAALFESFIYPFVIMFSVPLAAVGGVVGLWIVAGFDDRQQLDVLTMLGFVILIGVVVNNAILIVHQALNFMRGVADSGTAGEKMSPRDAIRESVRTRMRPILMTTLTSLCGMLPLVVMPGSGSELYKGLGGVVLGGLLVSTVFTLVVVPLVFSLTVEAEAAVKGWVGRSTGP